MLFHKLIYKNMNTKKIFKKINSFFIKLLLLVGLTMIRCISNDEIQQQSCKTTKEKGTVGNIIGNWKLVKQDRLFISPGKIDHSCDDIIFSFKKDSTYTISSNNPTFLESSEGSIEYQLQAIDLSKNAFKFTARGIDWHCTISEYDMIWDNTILDGGRRIFIRIKQ